MQERKPMAQRILILFAHPAFHRSRANRALVAAATEVEGVTLRDLYALYPGFEIDVKLEQHQLLSHDVLIFQHPFYWYSTPAILKEWQDLVLEHGWAYGVGGTALHGKTFLSVVTTSGSAEAYTHEGMHGRTMRELLAPVDQTFRLCGMHRLPPFVVHAAPRLTPAALLDAGQSYRRVLVALRDGALDRKRAEGLERLNEDPTVLETRSGEP